MNDHPFGKRITVKDGEGVERVSLGPAFSNTCNQGTMNRQTALKREKQSFIFVIFKSIFPDESYEFSPS